MCASRILNKRKHVLAKALLPKAALLDWPAPGLRLRETAKPTKMIQYLSKVVCQHFLNWFVGETFKNLNTFFCQEKNYINVLGLPKFGIPPVYAVYLRILHWCTHNMISIAGKCTSNGILVNSVFYSGYTRHSHVYYQPCSTGVKRGPSRQDIRRPWTPVNERWKGRS